MPLSQPQAQQPQQDKEQQQQQPQGQASASPGARLALLLLRDVTARHLRRLGRFTVGPVIGRGASGVVRVGRDEATGERVAIKAIDATRFRSLQEIEQARAGGGGGDGLSRGSGIIIAYLLFAFLPHPHTHATTSSLNT